MWRRGRPAAEDFAAEDDLFYRVAPTQVVGPDIVIPLGHQPPFDFPRFSVNWSRFSKPAWVLFPPSSEPEKSYEGFRVGAIRVGDLPVAYRGFTLRPVHRPVDDNYAHAEVESVDVVTQAVKKPDRPTRKELRELLRNKVRLVENG